MREILNELKQLNYKKLQDAKQIWKTTQEMQIYIEKGEIEPLVQAIELRQSWIEQSKDSGEKIHKKLKVLCEKHLIKNIESLDQNLYPEGQKILFNKNATQDFYKKIYDLEKQNQSRAEGLLKKYKDNIINIQQGKQAYQVYGRQPIGQSLLLNKVK